MCWFCTFQTTLIACLLVNDQAREDLPVGSQPLSKRSGIVAEDYSHATFQFQPLRLSNSPLGLDVSTSSLMLVLLRSGKSKSKSGKASQVPRCQLVCLSPPVPAAIWAQLSWYWGRGKSAPLYPLLEVSELFPWVSAEVRVFFSLNSDTGLRGRKTKGSCRVIS